MRIEKIWGTFQNEPLLDLEDIQPSLIVKNTRPDIVVIKLREPFNLNKNVKPAHLPDKAIKLDYECYVSGWGHYKPLTPEELIQVNHYIHSTK